MWKTRGLQDHKHALAASGLLRPASSCSYCARQYRCCASQALLNIISLGLLPNCPCLLVSYEAEGGRKIVVDSIHYDSLPAVGKEALAQQASAHMRSPCKQPACRVCRQSPPAKERESALIAVAAVVAVKNRKTVLRQFYNPSHVCLSFQVQGVDADVAFKSRLRRVELDLEEGSLVGGLPVWLDFCHF